MASKSPLSHPKSIIRNPQSAIRNPLRRGFTLTELLIVVAIMVVVAAFLIPAIKPALQDRKIRESARMVNVFFASAQARAIEKQRPVGVWLERNPNNNNECIQLYMADVPPPYSGDTLDALTIATGNPRPAPQLGCVGLAQFTGNCSMLASQVVQGDLVKFAYKGPYYTITSNPTLGPPQPPLPAAGPPVFQFSFEHSSAPPPRGTLGVPYQILRQPKRSSATTFALPTKTCINLYFSGGGYGGHGPPATVGGGAAGPTDTTPLIVCFGPSGRLDRAYARDPADVATDPLGRWKAVLASEALYLFVARNDRDGVNSDDQRNLEDTSNLWVTVAHRTGMTTTVDNVNTSAMPFPAPSSAANIAIRAAKVAEARRLAREKTGMGGR